MTDAQRRPSAPARASDQAQAQVRARAAHLRGLQVGHAGRPATAARQLRAGLALLGWDDGKRLDLRRIQPAHRALAVRLLMSLAVFEAGQGRPDYGLRLLAEASGFVPAGDQGVLAGHRGLLLMRTWRHADALAALNEAVGALAGNTAERELFAGALLNRGFLHLNTGQVGRARADLVWCRRTASDAGLDLVTAKAEHNLGYCELLSGDIPAALRLLGTAADTYQRIAPGNLPVLAMDRARALLAAGLAADAASELDGAIVSFRRQRLDLDLADAELARSRAALASGDLAAAGRWAQLAERRFSRHGNDACACLAQLIRLRVRAMSPRIGATSPRGRGSIAATALALAGRLRDRGLSSDAEAAGLLAARALIAAGRPGEARRLITEPRRGGGVAWLDVSLLRKLARAELAQAEGQAGRALAELRAGLAMVHARRGRFGSLELQTAAAALGADLAAAGLRLALAGGSAPLVFAWLERSRAQAFRVRPVAPPADPADAALLAELRQLSRLIRGAELDGRRDLASIARRTELLRVIRERSWQASGTGAGTLPSSLGEVLGALRDSGQRMVCFLVADGRMLALVLGAGPVRLVGLGAAGAVTEAAARLGADLDTLAGQRLPARLQIVITESARHQAAALTAELLVPLREWLGDGGVVLVPAAAQAGIPWSLLPGLRGRPVTVCPSASAWLAARRRARPPGPPGLPASPGPVPVLAAGPDLRHAAGEVAQIARIYPGCRPLLGKEATVRATLRALDGAALAHLAAHGHHEPENVLFSRLDLADGPLMAHDIQRLAVAPRQVVLSACDVGRTVVRPGEEILGFTAALLYAGTSTVISSVCRVDDDEAVGVMAHYHRLHAEGARPAEALAMAGLAAPVSPFVCFGSG